jgi:hypothetical protein
MTLQKQGSEGAVLFVKRVEAKQISSLFITYNNIRHHLQRKTSE